MMQLGTNPTPGCPLFSEFVLDFAAIGQIVLPSDHTVLLIAADSRDVPTQVISHVAERLLASGLIWVCVWGPDCQRVHDIFDEVHVGNGSLVPDFTLMSTWHENESLEEAVDFFLHSAFPLDNEIETTSYVAVSVGCAEWNATLNNAILNSGTSSMPLDEPDI